MGNKAIKEKKNSAVECEVPIDELLLRAFLLLTLIILVIWILRRDINLVKNIVVAAISSRISAVINHIHFKDNELMQFVIDMLVPFIAFFFILGEKDWAKNVILIGLINNWFNCLGDIVSRFGEKKKRDNIFSYLL